MRLSHLRNDAGARERENGPFSSPPPWREVYVSVADRFEMPDARARARAMSARTRRADKVPRRLIGAVQIIEAISRTPYRGGGRREGREQRAGGPGAMHIQRAPRGPERARPYDATTISETNPLMINKGIRQPGWTRERLADNLSVAYS